MARVLRWNKEHRQDLLKMVKAGVPEQEIREKFSTSDKKAGPRAMTAVEFAQQLKLAMVEAGEIKQAERTKNDVKPVCYEVTPTGRLTIPEFAELTGAKTGDRFVVESPRGRSKAWRVLPFIEE